MAPRRAQADAGCMNATDAMMDTIDTTDHAENPDVPGSVPTPPPSPPNPPTGDLPPQPLPPPSPFQPPARTPWWKRPVSRVPNGKGGGKVGGVVSGLAQAYGFDVRTSRIAVVVAPFVLPIIPLLYVALWILLPKSPAEAVPLDSLIRDRQRMPLVVVIGVILVASGIGSFGPWFAFGGFPWGLALIGIGVLLWVSPELLGSSNRSTPEAAVGTQRVGEPWAPSTGQPVPPLPMSAAPPVVRRRRRPIGWLAIGVGALFVAVVEGLDAIDVWSPAVLTVAITAIAIAIGGLFVSAAVNRSVLGVPAILMLSAALGFLAVARPQLEGGFGERNIVVAGPTASSRTERLGAGRLRIDLSFESAPTFALDATIGLGQIEVIVPSGAIVHLNSDVRAGTVEVDGDKILDGVHIIDGRSLSPLTPAAATPAAGAPTTGTPTTGAPTTGAPTTTSPTGAPTTTSPAPATGTPTAISPVIDLTLRVGAGQISVVHAG